MFNQTMGNGNAEEFHNTDLIIFLQLDLFYEIGNMSADDNDWCNNVV